MPKAERTYSKNNVLKYIMPQSTDSMHHNDSVFVSCRSQAISHWLSSTAWNDQEAIEVEWSSVPPKPALNAALNLKQQSDTVLRAWSPMWLRYSYDMCLKPQFSPTLITADPLIHSAHQSKRLATLSLFKFYLIFCLLKGWTSDRRLFMSTIMAFSTKMHFF